MVPPDKSRLVTKSPLRQDSDTQPVVYRIRWLMLTLFCLYSFSNSYQWIHLSIIANEVTSYYNASLPTEGYQRHTTVDWLSMVYMLAYIPLIFPAAWLLDRRGLRTVCIIGSVLNCVGAWLKCASVGVERFALLLFAQTLCSIAQIFVLGIPARLSAVWFGENELATATSLGVFGNQLGAAVGFVLPPMLVPNSEDIDTLGRSLSTMFYINASFASMISLLIIILFKGEPPTPPNRAQQLREAELFISENYVVSLSKLFKNRGFLALLVAYGINAGSYYAIATLLNPIILQYFPGKELNAGRIGLTIIVMGFLGAIVAGIWLDKTKTFKSTTIFIYIMTLTGMVAFTFTLGIQYISVVFVTAGVLGFFMTGNLPVGFEFAAEITYPESEGTSSGLLNASAQLFGIIFTLGMRAMADSLSTVSANIAICGFLLLGLIITVIIKPDYRRQNAGTVYTAKTYNQEMPVIIRTTDLDSTDVEDVKAS